MRTRNILAAAAIVLTVAGTSCQREIVSRNMEFPALNPLNADTNAGNWKPILISSVTEFSIDAPLATSHADYKLELLEIKSRQNNLSANEKSQIKYWSAGSVLRWNEIMRELVAKYNLPPYQNPDGTYPAPNAANPLAYPYFPFANPPYASRAYAYLTAAMYDALISGYHYKNIHKRPRPHLVDPTITELIPVAEGYCYPSEDAVAAGAAAAVLTMMFPGEQEYIQQRLTECLNYRILAGANTRSDMVAGEKLGRAVAGKFITRARNDRAGKAGGSAADYIKFENAVVANGQIPWKSQESPARPGMLPLFGRVIGFLVDTNEVVSGRPAAPPSTSSDQFKKELDEVLWYSEHPTRERMAIVHFWGDGIATPTPPGHWNAIACEDFVNKRFSEVRWARNLALLNMAMFDAAICCWDAKYFYYNPRPSQVNNKIKTLTGLPNFPSYTSGHSTFSGAAATFLSHVVPDRASAYMEMAQEASLSRLYGAIHYRSDIEVGMTMGKTIGNKAVDRAKTDGAE